jgi:L-asparaginase II
VGSIPLIETTRGTARESLHRGAVAVVDRTGRVRYRAGDPELALFLRSSAKPLQALPLVESGAADTLGLTEPELAVICGSHAAEPEHVAAVRSILSKAGLDEGALQCGAHAPGDAAQAAALAREGRSPTAIHNNCSGKHAGMLVACRVRGWPVDSYRAPDHPLQREIAAVVGAFCGVPQDDVVLGIDGCGVPTFQLTVSQVARAFAGLADASALPAGRRDAVGRITQAMVAHPTMVSGTGRLNAVLMQALGDRLFAKTGAEAVFGIGLTSHGWGIGIKIEDGNNRGMGAVVLETLRQLEVVTPPELEALASHHRPTIRNHEGRAVGEMHAVFTLERVA